MRMMSIGNGILINPHQIVSIREALDMDAYHAARVGHIRYTNAKRNVDAQTRDAIYLQTLEEYRTAPNLDDYNRVLIKTSDGEYYYVNEDFEEVKNLLFDHV